MRARWQVVVAVAALVLAAALMWVRSLRQQAWLEEMVASGCWPLVSMADIVALVWASVALVLVAGVLLIVGRRNGSSRAGTAATIQLALGIAVLVVAALFALYAWTLPFDPLDGIDGSGLPCGGG